MTPAEDNCCYLCEIGNEGLKVPINGNLVLICLRCLLECIHLHPKLIEFDRKIA